MKSLSSVGLGLSLVFGCLLFALVAEIYYLFWWKKRIITRDDYSSSSSSREFLPMLCFKKSPSLNSASMNHRELCSSLRITEDSSTHVHEPQVQLQSNNDLWLNHPSGENCAESELMRLQNFSGPPRFLFTIVEETKEDLESEDGKSRIDATSRKGSISRSLSDLLLTVETPFLTPLASPSYFTPPLTPIDSSNSLNGVNPFFESSSDAQFNRMRSSPPPKFKFLKDAEEKLYRKKLREEAQKGLHKIDGSVQNGVAPSTSTFLKNEEKGSFITLIVSKNKERELNQQQNVPQYLSSSSRVLPLTSPPSTFREPANKRSILH